MFGLQVGEELKGQKPDVKREIWDRTPVFTCNCFEPVDFQLTEPIHRRPCTADLLTYESDRGARMR